MLTVLQIADGVQVASREYPLRKVELFGSYASGMNTLHSDVDLLVAFSPAGVLLLTISALKLRMEDVYETAAADFPALKEQIEEIL